MDPNQNKKPTTGQSSRNETSRQTPTNGRPCSNLWPKNATTGPQISLSWHPDLPGVIRRLVDWYKQPYGALVLAGGYGSGKTTMAKIILHAIGGPIPVIDWSSGRAVSVRNAIFYTEPELLEDIRKSYSSDGETRIIGQCRTARLLILDDLGAAYVKEESSRWYEDIIWRMLNDRALLKTLITTNLTPPELKTRIGGRAFSRLQEMLGGPDNFVGMFNIKDYRAKDWQGEK